MKNSLKGKIVGLIVVLLVVAVCIVTFSNYYFTLDLEEQNIEDEHMFYANSVSDTVSNFIEKAYTITDNIQASKNIYEFQPEEQREFLEERIEEYPFFDLFYVQGTDGMQTARSSGENGDRSNRWWFKQAMEEREPFVGKSYYSVSTNTPVTPVIIPIYDEENQLVGIMGSDITLDEVQNMIDDYASDDKYAMVVDGEGTIVAHPDRNYVSELYNLIDYEKTVVVYDENDDPVLDSDGNHKTETQDIDLEPEYQDITLEVLEGNVGATSFTDNDGNDLLITYSDIELPGSSDNWGVIAVQDEGAALSNFVESTYKSLIVAFVMLIIAILCGLWMSSRITKPLITLKEVVAEGAKGKLNVSSNISSNDEIGELSKMIDTMFQQIGTLIKNISDVGEDVLSSSEQLSSTTEESAKATDEVSKTIEDIAKSSSDQAKDTEKGVEHVNELSNIIENDQENVKDMNTSISEVSKLKDEGTEILDQLVEQTNNNNKSVQEVHKTITETNESTTKIENASQMIKSISEQTNLLALNAAIEAARAGEKGKGFAVVAEEIRKLAEQSNQFTDEIYNIISELVNKTEHAVNSMQETSENVKLQTESVELIHDKFKGIASAIEKMNEVIENINNSGKVVDSKKDELISIIENLSAISEENAAGTQEASASVEEQNASFEEIARASERLAEIAKELQESVEKFEY
ncbi:methyl-accepting chemotaxis protein [Natranaerobius trueperi]|uniref:Methyl-accepting chemotaxis protein n=1 Tax=Natranaerobius trueperi TaxID=759412 RepID=A0A226BXV0_9FIRM|nr:methyl-accepting chemotaxis protein [Natranaerobius trueperi]OWZ83858.1 hypothetical protein CDO51_06380 [Natranaerobius trueperi]